MASRDVNSYKHALEVEKKRERLIKEAMREKLEAENASHHAMHHQAKASRLTRGVRTVGLSKPIIGYLFIALVLAFVIFLFARQYHWFG